MLKFLQWPLWLHEAWYNKECIHRLANSRKGCTSIVISMSVYICLFLSEDISGTTHTMFSKFLVHVAYGRGSILEGGEVCDCFVVFADDIPVNYCTKLTNELYL